MSAEPVVTFKSVPQSTDLLWEIRKRAIELQKFFQPIRLCEVTVDSERHPGKGPQYRVRIDVEVPGGTIVVARSPILDGTSRTWALGRLTRQQEMTPEHRQARAAIRGAFAQARRRLQDFARRRASEPSAHPRLSTVVM